MDGWDAIEAVSPYVEVPDVVDGGIGRWIVDVGKGLRGGGWGGFCWTALRLSWRSDPRCKRYVRV